MSDEWAQSQSADFVVIGGGPAGLATSLELTNKGCSVIVVERSQFYKNRVGESFPPAIQHPLAQLGLWDSFCAAGHLPSFGIRSVWGSSRPNERSFLFDAYGAGWHVDRKGFDAWLASRAIERGVALRFGCRLKGCQQTPNGSWSLQLNSVEGPSEIHTGFLVDATGRASAIARAIGVRRVAYDKLVGVVGFFCSNVDPMPVDATVLLEAVETGWWYSAPLPDHRLVVAFMTDGDLCAKFSLANQASWQRHLGQTDYTRHRTASFALRELRAVGAGTSCLEASHASRWLAVGDAAFAFDPLSGDGVYRAITTGRRAARALLSFEDGNCSALERCREEQEETFKHYLRTRQKYYHREERWVQSPFWMRRRSHAPHAVAS